jgi:hypothetical protein
VVRVARSVPVSTLMIRAGQIYDGEKQLYIRSYVFFRMFLPRAVRHVG